MRPFFIFFSNQFDALGLNYKLKTLMSFQPAVNNLKIVHTEDSSDKFKLQCAKHKLILCVNIFSLGTVQVTHGIEHFNICIDACFN